MGQRPRHRHPLLLAAGQAVRKAVGAVGETDLFQQTQGPLRCLRPGPPGQLQGQHQVLQGRQRRNQVEELEHEADAAAAEQGPLPLGESPKGNAGDTDLPGGRQVDTAQKVEQRGLTRAAPA